MRHLCCREAQEFQSRDVLGAGYWSPHPPHARGGVAPEQSVQSHREGEGADIPHGKATVSRFGTRIGADGSLSEHLEPAQRKKCAGISRWVYHSG